MRRLGQLRRRTKEKYVVPAPESGFPWALIHPPHVKDIQVTFDLDKGGDPCSVKIVASIISQRKPNKLDSTILVAVFPAGRKSISRCYLYSPVSCCSLSCCIGRVSWLAVVGEPYVSSAWVTMMPCVLGMGTKGQVRRCPASGAAAQGRDKRCS